MYISLLSLEALLQRTIRIDKALQQKERNDYDEVLLSRIPQIGSE